MPQKDRFLRGVLTRPRSVLAWTVALLLVGTWMALRVPLEWAPTLKLPSITITAAWPGASPQAIERYVTSPIERALEGVSGTAGIESYSREGRAFLRVSVQEGQSLWRVVAEISDRLAAVRPLLPERVVPGFTHEIPESLKDQQGFMTLELVGAISPERLRRLAEELVAPRLRSLPGVANVTVEGGEQRELLVALNPDQLYAHGLSVGDVQRRLQEALSGRSYGWIRENGGQALLWSQGEESASAVERLVVSGGPGRPLRLADVGRVAVGPAPVWSMSRVDGKPVVTLALDRAPGSHLLEVAGRVENLLAGLRTELPSGTEILVADDRSEDLRRELRGLALQGGLGLLAIAAILAMVLRSGRAMGIVLFTVAVALSMGVALLRPLGLTLNVLTLAGLALLVGLLVDGATVVVERLLVERKSGEAGEDRYTLAVARTLKAVWLPLLGGTLTTAAIFLPMVYLSGELRTLFLPFAALCAFTLVFSLLGATFLVPVLGRFLPVRHAPRKHRSAWRRRSGAVLLAPFRIASRHPVAALALLALAVGIPTPLLPDEKKVPEEGWASAREEAEAARYNATVGSDRVRNLRRWLDPLAGGVTRPFLKHVELGEGWDFEDRPQVTVWMKLPPGSGIERVDERIRAFETCALGNSSVRRTLTRVGEGSASLRILFKDGALDTEEPFELRERLIAQALQVAGLEVSISGLVPGGFYSGLGDVSGIRVEAHGPSYEQLDQEIKTFAERVSQDPRVARVDTEAGRFGEASGREVLRFRWGAEAVARTGISSGEISSILRSRLLTQAPTLFARLEGDPRMPVRLVTAGADGQDVSHLLELPLRGRGDSRETLRLAGLAELTAEREPPAIEREDQQYRRYVDVLYRGSYRMGKESVDQEIRGMRLPPGYRLARPKGSLFQEDARKDLFWLIVGTLGLVFLVIAAVLESWRLAGLVMVCVPLAWIGVATGFLTSEQSFGEGAFLGVVLVIGVSVNSGILLAYRFHQLRSARPGAPASRLALLAVRSRLRPMWATTLSSVAGIVPMLLVSGAKSFWIGLAITVVGGLLSSALLAPVAMVALLSWRSPHRVALAEKAKGGRLIPHPSETPA